MLTEGYGGGGSGKGSDNIETYKPTDLITKDNSTTPTYTTQNNKDTAAAGKKLDPVCGLVARVPVYRSRDPGSIPGTTRFSE
jgi:hypothetical protein